MLSLRIASVSIAALIALLLVADGGSVGAVLHSCPVGRLAYSGPDGRIWIAGPDNSDARHVSSISGFSATWSPDGRRIAFRHLDAGGSFIYVVNADGTGERRLSEGTSDWSPAWSPDGSRIVYSRDRSGYQQLVAVDPSGEQLTWLTPTQEGEYPAWSPDGTRIAYASASRGQYDVWVMNADGSHKHNLTRNPAYDMYPAWSPDGTKIAFGSDRTRPNSADFVEQDVFVMNADGTNLRDITRTRAVAEGFPAWRPDGSLSFVRGNDPAHPPTLWVSDANGNDARSLDFDAQFPAWEPPTALDCHPSVAERRLAFVRTAGDDRFDVFVADGNGLNDIDITNSAATESFPTWSPDGALLLFIEGDDVGRGTIVVTAPDGSMRSKPFPSFADARSASWSPDGRKIAFSVFGGSGQIYVGNSDGSGLHALAPTSASNSPAWSPNGRFIAYRQEYPSNDEIVRIRLSDGAIRRLTHTPPGTNDLSPAWSPDGSTIAYSSGTSWPSTSIWLMNGSGRDRRRLTAVPADQGFPSWTEDGSAVVFERHGALWTSRADGVEQRRLLDDAHFPSVRPAGSSREPARLTLSLRARGRRLSITGRLAAGGAALGNALVELRLRGRRLSARARTGGGGRYVKMLRAPKPLGSGGVRVTAFFAGDSSTLAAVASGSLLPSSVKARART